MAKTTYSELLPRFGSLHTLPNNPFYILGLPVDATPRQLRRRREDLESAHDMGESAWRDAFPHLLRGSRIPTLAEVEDAFSRLEDVEERLIASYYWFWKPHGESASFQKAFDTFLKGDPNEAELQWLCIEKEMAVHEREMLFQDTALSNGRVTGTIQGKWDGWREIAEHNVRVLARLRAMVWDLSALESGDLLTREEAKTLDDLWVEAMVRTRSARSGYRDSVTGKIVPNGEWGVFLADMRSLNDPRITEDLLEVLKQVVRDLPAYWQATFVCEYARKDEWDDVKAHMALIRDHMPKFALSESVLDCLFENVLHRHHSLISHLEAKVQKNPLEGVSASNELIDSTAGDYNAVYALLGGDKPVDGLHEAQEKLRGVRKDPKDLFSVLEVQSAQREVEQQETYLRMREALYDPVLRACFRFIVKYSEATKDWDIAIQWDEFLQGIAVSEKLKNDIAQDMRAIHRAQVSELVERYNRMVKAQAKMGYEAARQMLADSQDILSSVVKRYGRGDALYNEIRDAIVAVCRGYLIDYGNETQDWDSCLSCMTSLLKMTKSGNLQGLVKKDIATLRANVQEDMVRNRCWHCKAPNTFSTHRVEMYGNVDFDYSDVSGSGIRRKWRVLTIPVPMCPTCMSKYNWSMIFAVVGPWLVLAVVIGACVGSVPAGFIITCLPGIAIGVSLIKFVRRHWFGDFPAVAEASRAGYRYGSGPAS